MKKNNNSKLKIIPLGGLEQIGMNITAFEYEDSIVVVDCGLSFLSLIHILSLYPHWLTSAFRGRR